MSVWNFGSVKSKNKIKEFKNLSLKELTLADMWTVIEIIFVQLRIPDWMFEMFWLSKYLNEPM